MKRFFLIAPLTLLLGACTVFTYTSSTGETTRLVRVGYDTKVGKINANASTSTQPASLSIEDLSTEARAVDTANKALDLTNKLIK